MLLNLALLSRRSYPLLYLLPGLFFLGLMVLYPISYNVGIAFTNYGTGHNLSREQVITHFENQYYIPKEAECFTYLVFKDAQGDLRILLISKTTGNSYLSNGEHLELVDPEEPRFIYKEGEIVGFDGYKRLNWVEGVRYLGAIEKLVFLKGEEEVIRLTPPEEFSVYRKQYRYDSTKDILVDLQTGTIYRPIEGIFTSEEDKKIWPGYRDNME